MIDFSDRVVTDAQVDAVDARIRALLEREGYEIVKGQVTGASDPITHTFAAYLDGSTDSSPGILYSLDPPVDGDIVLVAKGPLTSRRLLLAIISRDRAAVIGGVSGGTLTNLDGGTPTSVYGGTTGIDGGGA